jgi:hypothetical protein
MKNSIIQLSAVLLALSLVLFSFGCATGSGGSGIYQLKQTRNDVETAMRTYRDANVAGDVSLADQKAVTAAYNAYQTAFDKALQDTGNNLNAPAPPNVKQLADQLLGILDALP